MTFRHTSIVAALAAAAFCIGGPAFAQAPRSASGGTDAPAKPLPSSRVDPRPADSTANLPSAEGAQSQLPSGAVTGAGHPYGTVAEPDVGKPGGLEERARAEARAEGKPERGSAGARSSPAESGRRATERGPDATR